MKRLILALLLSMLLSIITGIFTIPFLRKIKAGQTILHYVKSHENKNGTPTMGGLFFIASATFIFLFFGGYKSKVALVSLSIGLAYLVVGFLDDYIKIRYKRNQGLKAYQKIVFQLGVAMLAGLYAYKSGMTVFYLPFINTEVNLQIFTFPTVVIIFLAITNSVNLSDGLDGLAGQVSVVYLIFLVALTMLQCENFNVLYLSLEEYSNLQLLSTSLIGSLLGFLTFNVSKASVFMGDTGSLSIGGFIGALSIFSLNSFFIPIIGIMFVVSSISVIIQVLHYKRTKERVFLMAPLHHHFQLKGYSEAKISYIYVLISIFFGLISLLSYL